MNIKPVGPGKYLVRFNYRRLVAGTTVPDHRQRTVTGTLRDARAVWADLRSEAKAVQAPGSLTIRTLGTEIARYRATRGDGGMESVFLRLQTRFQDTPIDDNCAGHIWDYIDELQALGRSKNTIGNYKGVLRAVLNESFSKGRIKSLPIHRWNITRTFRDRVPSLDEILRLRNAMERCDSHLRWSFELSIRNPIRGPSDLWTLTRENLKLTGPNAPYIQFRARKTSNKKPVDTILPEIDSDDVAYFLSLPSDCPYLFPHLIERKGVVSWSRMGSPKRHWRTLCRRAVVENLHWHDLKHYALTWMIMERGYTIPQILALGLQFSEDMIRRVYYHRDAQRVLSQIRNCRTECRTVANA